MLVCAREAYNDEDSRLNGALIGAPGKLRVQVYSKSHHAANGQTVLVSSLKGLVREASTMFNQEIDRIYTKDGLVVSELFVPSAGRSCLYDGTRCVFDGATLFAVVQGASFSPDERVL